MSDKLPSTDGWFVILASAIFGAAVGCYFRGRHDTRPHPIGGRKCKNCGSALADMEDSGELDDVQLRRTRTYERGRHGGSERADGFSFHDHPRIRRR